LTAESTDTASAAQAAQMENAMLAIVPGWRIGRHGAAGAKRLVGLPREKAPMQFARTMEG
jgi:hypothetical protein